MWGGGRPYFNPDESSIALRAQYPPKLTEGTSLVQLRFVFVNAGALFLQLTEPLCGQGLGFLFIDQYQSKFDEHSISARVRCVLIHLQSTRMRRSFVLVKNCIAQKQKTT